MGDVGGSQAADGGLRDGGVDEELVLGEGAREIEVVFASGGVEDSLGACLQSRFKLFAVSMKSTSFPMHILQLE